MRRRRPRVGSDGRRDHHCGDANHWGDAHHCGDAHDRSADAHLRGSAHNGGRGDDRASFDRARLYDAGIDR